MKFLKYLGIAVALLVVVAVIVVLVRTDPIGPISGKRLSGVEQPFPDDWMLVNEHPLCALETRIDDPHSVTTLCFVHDGALMIPAGQGSSKTWPRYVLADPRVRVKVGEVVFPGIATRMTEIPLEDLVASLAVKYPQQFADGPPEDLPADIWLFRISAP